MKRICPICNKEYTDAPAMSRERAGQPICPECGTMEALDAERTMIGSGMSNTEWEAYKRDIIEKMRAR